MFTIYTMYVGLITLIIPTFLFAIVVPGKLLRSIFLVVSGLLTAFLIFCIICKNSSDQDNVRDGEEYYIGYYKLVPNKSYCPYLDLRQYADAVFCFKNDHTFFISKTIPLLPGNCGTWTYENFDNEIIMFDYVFSPSKECKIDQIPLLSDLPDTLITIDNSNHEWEFEKEDIKNPDSCYILVFRKVKVLERKQ